MNIRRWPAEVLVAPIRFCQRFITPYTPPSCRYYPTCSAYAVTALRTRGAAIGTALTLWRLLRCNPWSEGGVDHVPATGWRSRPQVGGAEGVPPGRSGSAEGPEPTAPPAVDPADLSGPPPTGGPDTTIGRFAA